MSDDERHWKLLETADDVTEEILEHVRSAVDWFEDEPSMPTEEFIDRLCHTYGGSGYGPKDFDLDSYDNPAVRKIMKVARAERRERQS